MAIQCKFSGKNFGTFCRNQANYLGMLLAVPVIG